MELLSLSCSTSHCCGINTQRSKWMVGTSTSFQSILLSQGKGGILSVGSWPRRQYTTIIGSTSGSHVADGGGTGFASAPTRRPSRSHPPDKVAIPSLPEEQGLGSSRGGGGSRSCFWEWKPKLTVHYECSGMDDPGAPALLLLPGFGVGTFHYEKQLQDLGRDHRVFTLDFLGQGRSLPVEDPTAGRGEQEEEEDAGVGSLWGFGERPEPWAEELAYSMDLWRDQVRDFVQEVIREPVYVVGNSLGGYVALYFAACNPTLVKGVTLLNATPFWGFLPNPVRSPRLAKLFPWAGTFPPPAGVRRVTEVLWEKISDPASIDDVLKQVYTDHSLKFDKVSSRIIEIAQHPAAPASFASIMFAPKAQLSFQEALNRCKLQDIPICLMYGREDPWVKPVWGLQVKRQVPSAPYYEISPAGHCPHDEVPEVVNFLLRGWVKALESQGLTPLPLLEELDYPEYSLSRDVEFLKEGYRKSVRVNLMGSSGVSVWNQIRWLLRSRNRNPRLRS